MKKTVRRLCACVLCLLACLPALPAAAYSGSDVTSAINGVINWKKAQGGSTSGRLFTESFAKTAGNGCDWYMVAAGRYGLQDDREAYLKHIAAYITDKYKTADRLDRRKATEWHRIALAVLAAGGDPRSIGKDESGSPVNLIADGVYNRGNTASLGKQGLNGWIWGLVALDSMQYAVPNGSFYTREDILKEILSYQLPDGGFSLAGTISDCDTTAAALIALAPYVSSGRQYTYTLKRGRQEVTRTAVQVTEAAVERLSELQLSTGGFTASGEETSESISQVIVALCSLGIDPQGDKRFIKNGNSALGALMSFREKDGGFAHLRGEGSNSMAGEQALCAFVSLHRLYNGLARFYDYTDGITMKAIPGGGASSGTSSGTDKKPSQGGDGSRQNSGAPGGGTQAQQGGSSGGGNPPQGSSAIQGGSSSQRPSGTGDTSSQKETRQSGGASSGEAAQANASAQAPSQSGAENAHEGAQEDNGGINPVIFIIIGAALIAGGLGFHFARIRNKKQEGNEEEDFFESLKTYREEHPDSTEGKAAENEPPAEEDEHEKP